jgi:GNAT superfamily N-acetyltransferase
MFHFAGQAGGGPLMSNVRPHRNTKVIAVSIRLHNEHPLPESAVADEGIGHSNDAAAPLHEIKPLACFARSESNEVIGGAIGRRWGGCCELEQLWVKPEYRHNGIATQLVAAFEGLAQTHGCSTFFLEPSTSKPLSSTAHLATPQHASTIATLMASSSTSWSST